ncbi:MAG: LPS export ABC transporter periplasmic protein LptC [Candidatus Hydrogenedentes bacterium]|nr:LPS export ABC transporter periplasmic protein LptC [Candidatus Hydrogenedentota bacterium]
MNRRAQTVLLLILFAAYGCGNGFNGHKPASPAAAPAPPNGPEQRANANMEGRGADFRLFDGDPTSGPARRPRLWLHVDSFSLAEQNIWSFKNARAVIYGRDEQMDDMFLEAGGGSYQEAKSAYLKDGVTAKIGEMKLELRDIEWLNDEALAKSDYPVTITTPDSELKASSVRLYHKEKQIVLTDVTGTLRLERAQQ